jgi:hypothetical protein
MTEAFKMPPASARWMTRDQNPVWSVSTAEPVIEGRDPFGFSLAPLAQVTVVAYL